MSIIAAFVELIPMLVRELRAWQSGDSPEPAWFAPLPFPDSLKVEARDRARAASELGSWSPDER